MNMRQKTRLSLAVCTAVFGLSLAGSLTAPAAAQWRIESETDALTDEVRTIATTENAEGFTLSLYRLDGQVWALFALPRGSLDVLAGDHLPTYRVDKYEPVALEGFRTVQPYMDRPLYDWQPGWVNFILWHGDEAEGLGGAILQFMTGEEVLFRYWLGTGGYKDTRFSLRGARAIISEALEIPLPKDSVPAPNGTRV